MPDGGGIAVKPIGGFLAALAQLESELAGRCTHRAGGRRRRRHRASLGARPTFRRKRGLRRTRACCPAPAHGRAAAHHAGLRHGRSHCRRPPPRARAVARAALAEARVELVFAASAPERRRDGRLALSDGSFLAVEAVLVGDQRRRPAAAGGDLALICDAVWQAACWWMRACAAAAMTSCSPPEIARQSRLRRVPRPGSGRCAPAPALPATFAAWRAACGPAPGGHYKPRRAGEDRRPRPRSRGGLAQRRGGRGSPGRPATRTGSMAGSCAAMRAPACHAGQSWLWELVTGRGGCW